MRFVLALIFVLWPGLLMAQWSGFYTPTEKDEPAATPRSTAPVTATPGDCIREILLAQLRHRIPGNLLLGIGLQESGLYREGELIVWPWTANAEGEGHYFEDASEAIKWVSALRIDGVSSVDVGCMQINLHWHPDAFDSVIEGFDPARNVDYAARYLVRLYEKTGDWTKAAGRYHSATEDVQAKYLERLEQNIAVANARIEDFRQIAGSSQRLASRVTASGQGATARQRAQAPREPMPTTGVFWTAWLGRADHEGAGGRSLFGPKRISPILPDLSKTF